MTIERWVRAFAGLFILTSLALARFVDPRFLWFTAFVGANLLQSSFTRFCPLASLLRVLGAPADREPSFRT
ncbi:MAG: DUF2892 domain-containing protein [Deltaproteobacteria bacterium]|nr:DUF2892 domain-containing protein [Deltaproteobacteria bacterium]